MERGIQIKGAEEPDPRAFDTDGVLVSQEEIEEQFGQVAFGCENIQPVFHEVTKGVKNSTELNTFRRTPCTVRIVFVLATSFARRENSACSSGFRRPCN